MLRIRKTSGLAGRLAVVAAALVALAVLAVALSAVHLLPRLRNPFAEQTTVTSQPVLLKSITALSRYEAASGSFQVVVDLLPHAQLEPAVLNVKESYVYAQQQGLLNRIGNFFGGNPNSQQQVYIAAQQRIQTAARRSPLLAEAERNTRSMLNGMLSSLGFRRITVNFASQAPAGH